MPLGVVRYNLIVPYIVGLFSCCLGYNCEHEAIPDMILQVEFADIQSGSEPSTTVCGGRFHI
jgi:hypothetical protein